MNPWLRPRPATPPVEPPRSDTEHHQRCECAVCNNIAMAATAVSAGAWHLMRLPVESIWDGSLFPEDDE